MKKTDKYSINIAWSEEDRSFIATSPVFGGLSALGTTKEEALKEAEIVLEQFLSLLEEKNEPIPDPDVSETYSGQFRLRIAKSLHRKLAESAKNEGVSLNQYIFTKLSSSDTEDRIYKTITYMIFNNPTVHINSADSGHNTPAFGFNGIDIKPALGFGRILGGNIND